MPSKQLNRILWVTVIVLIGFFAYRAQDTIEMALSGVGKLDVRPEPHSSTLYLRWRGQVDSPMAQRISEALDKHGGEASRIVLSLSSPGGSLVHGAEVIRLLQRAGDRRQLETIVEGRGICASMCVPVYLQGQLRRASENARFMFHEVSFRESFSDDKVDVPERAIGNATDRFFVRYFLPAGVPEDWVRQVRRDISGGIDVWKSARELVDENAGIVQRID